MLLTRSTYTRILDFGLNESATLIPVVNQIGLGYLSPNGELEILDISRIAPGEWEEANGALRNVRSRVFFNDSKGDKLVNQVLFLSSDDEVLSLAKISELVKLKPGERLAIPHNQVGVPLAGQSFEFNNDTKLGALEAVAAGNAQLEHGLLNARLGTELSDPVLTGARLYTYLTFSVNAVGTGALGNMQLYAYPIELENTFLRIRATASGSATLTSEATTGLGEAVGTASLTGDADGIIVVIAVSDSLGPLTGTADGQVRVAAQAADTASLAGDSSANTDVPAVADSLGPLVGATIDANTRIKFNATADDSVSIVGGATAEVTVFATATDTASLTGTSDGISAAFATASGSASLTAAAAGNTDVPAVADALGPLVGDAVGDVIVFADAIGTATLTTDATSTTDVPAAADALGPLTGVADGQISLLRVSASAALAAVGDTAGSVIVSAGASVTAELTVDADGGTVPLLISDAVVSFLSGQGDINTPLEGDVIETTLGVWESDPTLIAPTDYTIQWQRVFTGPVTEVVNWTGVPGYTNVSHNIQADGGIAKTSGPSSGGNSAHKSEDVNNVITLEGGSIQFRANTAAAIGVGLTRDPDILSSVYFNTFDYSFFLSGGQYSVRENGTNVAANIGTYTTTDIFTIERNPTTDEIEYKFNGTTVYTSLNLINNSDDLYPVVCVIQSGGEVIEADVTRNNVTQITPIVGANNTQYTTVAADEGFQIRSVITVDNGYIDSADVKDITSTSNATGVASSTFPATASASASLAGQSTSGVDTFASADATASLTGDSNANITLLRAGATATASLAGDSSANTDVPAVADALGPLVGVADGQISRIPASADTATSLTTVAVANTDVNAVADSLGPLVGDVSANVRVFADASATADLTGDTNGNTTVSANVVAATASLTGDSNANITLLRAGATSTSTLTGDSSANTDVPAVADTLGPLTGAAEGIISRQPGVASADSTLTTVAIGGTASSAVAFDTSTLTGDSSANITLLRAGATATSTLTGDSSANTDVNAVADSLGPLVGVADGQISRIPAEADAAASLTGDSSANTDVNAVADALGPLTGAASANVRVFADSAGTADLVGTAAGGSEVNAVADSLGPLVGAADGSISLLRANSSTTASLTGDSNATVDASASASVTSSLIGVVDGILSRQPAIATVSTSLTGDAAAVISTVTAAASGSSTLSSTALSNVEVGAVADSLGPLVGAADGDVTLLRAGADATADLTGNADSNVIISASSDSTASLSESADSAVVSNGVASTNIALIGDSAGGTIPINTVIPVITDLNGGDVIIGDTLSVSNGAWESDPALGASDFDYLWSRLGVGSLTWTALTNSSDVQILSNGGIKRSNSGGASWSAGAANASQTLGSADDYFELVVTDYDFNIIAVLDAPLTDPIIPIGDIVADSLVNVQAFAGDKLRIRSGNGTSVNFDQIINNVGAAATVRITRRASDFLLQVNGGNDLAIPATPASTCHLAWIGYTQNASGWSSGEVSSSTTVGANQSTYTLSASDVNFEIECTVTANNGFGGDISVTSNLIGPVIDTLNGDASATSELTGSANGDTSSTASASTTSSLTGDVSGLLSRQPGIANATASLTGDADGELSRISAAATGVSSLSSTVLAGVEVGAVADSLGPLTGVADGTISLLRADADATADLTGNADADTTVAANAEGTADLTGDSSATVTAFAIANSTANLTSATEGVLGLQPGIADVTASLAGDADGSVTVSAADADATADLTGDSDGAITLLRINADATLDLTGDANAAGVSPTNITPPVMNSGNVYTVGQTIEISEGTWTGDPDPTV